MVEVEGFAFYLCIIYQVLSLLSVLSSKAPPKKILPSAVPQGKAETLMQKGKIPSQERKTHDSTCTVAT
jgi:hypothetical protein